MRKYSNRSFTDDEKRLVDELIEMIEQHVCKIRQMVNGDEQRYGINMAITDFKQKDATLLDAIAYINCQRITEEEVDES